MSKSSGGTRVRRSQQIAATCDHRAKQQTKTLHVDCWTSGLLVSCREWSRPEDQKTRKPSYRYWSPTNVEVLILLFDAKKAHHK